MSRLGGTGLTAACVLAGAWILGSTALVVLGVGLALAALAARGWTVAVVRRLAVERRPLDGPPVEGQPLRLGVDVCGPRWLASRLVWRDRLGTLGERSVGVGADGSAVIVVEAPPRGRYRVGPGSLLATDLLGLGRAEVTLDREVRVTVRPRVPDLHTLFTDTGTWAEGGRRMLLRRPSGLEPHGVREYVEGEPLRAVHWPTSARRGELMVRELEDAPRESVAVVLDVDADSVAGPSGASSLDDAVRAAAGLVHAHALRSRRVLLVVAAPDPVVQRVRGVGPDWELALDALAAAEPCRAAPLRALVAPRGAVAAVPELVVVTARPEVVADALAARASLARSTAARGSRRADLRRTAAGTPVAGVAAARRRRRGGRRRPSRHAAPRGARRVAGEGSWLSSSPPVRCSRPHPASRSFSTRGPCSNRPCRPVRSSLRAPWHFCPRFCEMVGGASQPRLQRAWRRSR